MLIIAAFFAVASLPAFSAVEYDYRETGGGINLHAVNTGAPLIATKAYSRAEILYKYEYTTLAAGNMITQLTYRGYNPGDSFTRHFVVWMENTQQRDILDQYDLTPTTSMTKVFEGDCTIPSGGTAEDRIPLLKIPFSTPFMYNGNTNSLRVVIESTGEAASQDVCFEHGKSTRLCFSAAAEDGNDNMEWERAQFPLTILTVATEVVSQAGQVIDQEGHLVSGAKVQMESNASGFHIAYENSTDDNGKYSIRIGEGERYYSARVSAPGHASYIDNFSMLAKKNPVRNFMLRNVIYYKAGQKATIIMPTAPSANWGKYYKMDRMDGNRLIFERELSPKANVPYVIIPETDFSVDLRDLDMSAEPDTLTLAGWLDDNNRYRYQIDFVGSYSSRNFFPTSNEICLFFNDEAESGWEERTNGNNIVRHIPRIGALHACLVIDAGYDIEVVFYDQTDGLPSLAGDTINSYTPLNVYINVEKIDQTVGVPPVLKTPKMPTVWIEGRELCCQGEHPAYVLSIIDCAGNLVYTAEFPESAMQVTLPTEPLEGFTVEFVDGTWRLYGRLAPDGYRPMVVDGKTWKGYEVDQLTGQRYRLDYFLDGDTLIGGKKYLRCFRDSERYQDKAPRYVGALFEEDGKVYGVSSFVSSPGLMYDFNLQVDDFVFGYMIEDPKNFTFVDKKNVGLRMDERGEEYFLSFRLKDIETIHDNSNAQMRRFVFDIQRHNVVQNTRPRSEYAYNQDSAQGTASGEANQTVNVVGTLYWSEGVGVENFYPFKPWEDPFNTQYKYQLEECYVDQKLMWARAFTTGIDHVQSLSVQSNTTAIFDISGRRLQGEPQRKGIYIRGGRKYVKK